MNPTDIPGFEAAVADLAARVESAVPEVRDIIEEGRSKGLSQNEVLQKLAHLLATDPSIGVRITAAATGNPLQVVEPQRGDGVVVPPPPGGTGLPRLDPLYEAHLMERVHLDGDAPELRTGALPPQATPAVPVETGARDPVAVGWMLEEASEQVAAEARAIEQGRVSEVVAQIEGKTEEEARVALGSPALLAKLERNSLPDPVGYVRGQAPVARVVEAPSGWGLAALTPEQQQQLAWKTLSTTQGRKSVLRAIRDLVAGGLINDGYAVRVVEGEPARVTPEEVVVFTEWSVDLSGPGSTQPGFSFVDTAARSLTRKLTAALDEKFDKTVGVPLVLDIIPVNTVDVRKVGWAARITQPQVSA